MPRSLLARFAPIQLIEAGTFLTLALVPWGPTGPRSIRQLALALLVAGLVARSFGVPRPSYRLRGPLVLFLTSYLLAIASSSNPGASLARSAHAPIALLFFFSGQEIARRAGSRWRLALVLCAVVSALGIDAGWQASQGASLLGAQPLHQGRATAGLPHPNDLAMIATFLPFAFALVRDSTSWVARAFAWASLPAGVAALLLSQSRNSWIGALVAGAVLARTRQRLLSMGLLAGSGLVLALILSPGGLSTRTASLTEWRLEGRVGIWLVAWRMFREAPLLGKGAHVFGEFYERYLPEVELPEGVVRENRPIPWAHNLYLELLAERGLVGLVAFGWVVAAAAASLRRAGALHGEPYAAATAASLAAFLAMATLDLTFLKDWVALDFWLIVGVAAGLSASPEARRSGLE